MCFGLSIIDSVLLHQCVGLDAFNELPTRRAVHALFECCNSVTMAADLARGRPYADRDTLFRRTDALLFALPDELFDDILEAYPGICGWPGGLSAVLEAIGGGLHNDAETERKILRNEIARLNRSRLERMLGPEGGYNNWA